MKASQDTLRNTEYVACIQIRLSTVSPSVWGLLPAGGKSPLVRINRALNQSWSIEILAQYLLLFKQKYHPRTQDFIYQHDGYGSHQAKLVSAFLQDNGV